MINDEKFLEFISALKVEDLRLSKKAKSYLLELREDTVLKLFLNFSEYSEKVGKVICNEINRELKKIRLSFYGHDIKQFSNVISVSQELHCQMSNEPGFKSNQVRPISVLFFLSKINSSNLPVRAINYFNEINLNYIYEIVLLSSNDLVNIPLLGRQTVLEIENELIKHGLTFKMTLQPNTEEFLTICSSRIDHIPSSDLIFDDFYCFLEFDRVSKVLNSYLDINTLNSAMLDYYSFKNVDLIIVELVNTLFVDLDEKEQLIASSRIFTLKNYETLDHLGMQLELTRERVRQIEARVIYNIKNQFSCSISYIETTLELIKKTNIDPFDLIIEARPFFKERAKFFEFLRSIGISSNTLIFFDLIDDMPDPVDIRNDLLLSYEMPILNIELEEIVSSSYGLSQVRCKAFIEVHLQKYLVKKNELVYIIAPTKYLAIANVSLGFPKGAPWLDLAKIAKEKFEKCKNIRTDPTADGSITSNPYLYLCNRGTYKNIKFYNVEPNEETIIEEKVYNFVLNMKEEVRTLISIKQELSLDIDLYDLLYLLKDKSQRFNFETKSGKMNVRKNDSNPDVQFNLKDIVLEYFKSKKQPQTCFQIKDCLKSRSENHVKLILSQLMEDGLVVRIDRLRYINISSINETQLELIKNEIKKIIISSEKIISGSFIKDQIEINHKVKFTRFFYSSIAKIVCKDYSFYWARGSCSKNEIPPGFSLTGYLENLLSNRPISSFNDFKLLVLDKVDIDDELLNAQFYRYKVKRKDNAA